MNDDNASRARAPRISVPPTPASPPPAAKGRIECTAIELEGFRSLRAQEVDLGRRIFDCARATLTRAGADPSVEYVAIRDERGAIVAFEPQNKEPTP